MVKFGSSDLFIAMFRISEFLGNWCSERQRFRRDTNEISDPHLHNCRLIFDIENRHAMLLNACKFHGNWCGEGHNIFRRINKILYRPDSSVGIATDFGLDGPGIESRLGGRLFARPDRPWGPPSLLYNGYRVFLVSKVRPGRAADHSPPSSAGVMEE